MTPAALQAVATRDFAVRFGHVRSVAAGLVEASGPDGVIGEICTIETDRSAKAILAEIVAVDEQRVLLTPMDPVAAIPIGARVVASSFGDTVPVGDGFAGRAVDPFGRPIDGGPDIWPVSRASAQGAIPEPLSRASPRSVAITGIRAIDGILTLGRGQRIGIIAAGGVGKTSLVEQIAVQTEADRVVLCLVGERGREVEELWRTLQAHSDLERFTIVAATSDESAARRARAPGQALALAEHWRERGEHVLLLLDSVTRLAMALREIGLAAGSPPTVRAYTPNVFAVLPRIVERCGAVAKGGAITAVMTVLSETDDADDPIVEVMKSLLDGHIHLSRTIAEQGQFPAIDIVRSISRGVETRVAAKHRSAQRALVAMLAAFEDSRVMIESGAYRSGTNEMVDRAITRRESVLRFLGQPMDQSVRFEDTVRELCAIGGERP